MVRVVLSPRRFSLPFLRFSLELGRTSAHHVVALDSRIAGGPLLSWFDGPQLPAWPCVAEDVEARRRRFVGQPAMQKLVPLRRV